MEHAAREANDVEMKANDDDDGQQQLVDHGNRGTQDSSNNAPDFVGRDYQTSLDPRTKLSPNIMYRYGSAPLGRLDISINVVVMDKYNWHIIPLKMM